MIESTKKILIKGITGINDFFSAIALNIDFCKKNNLNIKNIYFTHKVYKNLNFYLNFKQINYIEYVSITDEKKYDILYTKALSNYTNLNYETPHYLSNYIEFKDDFLKNIEKIKVDCGIHFRFRCLEHVPEQTSIFLEKAERSASAYMEKFFKIYDKNKNYFLCSSSPTLNNFFKDFKNILYYPKQYVASKGKNRNLYTADVFNDLALLSQCPLLYKTEGGFTFGAKMLGKGVPQIKDL